MHVTIRPERPDEAAEIRTLHDASFGESVPGRIVDDVRGTDRWIDGGSLVAHDPNARLVGHLLLSEGDLELARGAVRRIWMLGPVAVLPAVQRRGIGGALMRAAITVATSRAQPLICLLGHASYYPRFGFEPARGIGIEAPHPWDDESWMALRLPAWTPDVRGIARFPPAFPAH